MSTENVENAQRKKPSREIFLAKLDETSPGFEQPAPGGASRRSSGAALRGSYRALYDNLPLMCFTLDAAGRVLEINAAAAEELGFASEELLDRPLFDLFHPADRTAAGELLQRALDEPERAVRKNLRKLRRDSTLLFVEETFRAVMEDGRAIVLAFAEDVSDRVAAEDDHVRYQGELRALTSAAVLAEEAERRRVAAGLHDRLGQLLAFARLRLAGLQESELHEPCRESLAEIRKLLDDALRETRTLTFELSCPALYSLGLEEALRDRSRHFDEKTATRFHFHGDRHPKPLAEETLVILYRVIEELLMNVVKHARAENAWIEVSVDGAEVRVVIEDDGRGFDLAELGKGPTPDGGFGLFASRERLDHIGGRLTIETLPGDGTRIVAIAPLATEPASTNPYEPRPGGIP